MSILGVSSGLAPLGSDPGLDSNSASDYHPPKNRRWPTMRANFRIGDNPEANLARRGRIGTPNGSLLAKARLSLSRKRGRVAVLTKAEACLPIAYQISELARRSLCQVIRRRITRPVNQSMRPIAVHPAILRTSLRGMTKDPIAAITMSVPVQ